MEVTSIVKWRTGENGEISEAHEEIITEFLPLINKEFDIENVLKPLTFDSEWDFEDLIDRAADDKLMRNFYNLRGRQVIQNESNASKYRKCPPELTEADLLCREDIYVATEDQRPVNEARSPKQSKALKRFQKPLVRDKK